MKKITLFLFGLFLIQANAQFTDYLTNLGTLVGMTKSGNNLYIGSIGESKILVADMSSPNPSAQDLVTGVSFPTKLVVVGSELYLTYGLNNVGKIDLTSPSPQLEFVLSVPGAYGLALKDNFLYVGDRNNGQILRFDYTVPTPLTELVVANLGSFMGGIAFNGDDLYVSRGSENIISKIDVSIANPPIVDVIEAESVLDVAFYGNDMYYSNNYLNRIDITSSVPTPEILAFNVSLIWDILFDGNDIFLAQQTEQKIITSDIANLNPISFTNNSFALDEIITNNLPTISQGATAMADVDGDNDLDLFITGNAQGVYIAKLFLNDGNGLFTEDTGNVFEGVAGNSSVAFADVDGDGDQDVLYFGYDISIVRKTKFYLNDGTGNFTEDTNNSFVGLTRGDITFGDVDGDNDNDLLLSGEIGATGYTQLFINNGSGGFTESTNNPFQPLASSAAAFSDIDGDNDLDVLLTGFDAGTQTNHTVLYTNDGNGNYTLVADTPFSGVIRGMIEFADLDGDLDDDVIIAGQIDNTNFGNLSRIYTNDGNGNFTANFSNNLVDVQEGSIGTTDIDGDGDLDIMIGGLETTGTNTFESRVNLYLNDGNGNFLEDNLFSAPGVYQMDFDFFADIDNDGDDDMFLFSNDFNTAQRLSKLYRNVPAIPEAERNILLELYSTTSGDNWFSNFNWNTRFSANMWHGVTTTIINDEMRVTGLDLTSNNLVGSFPESITNLSELEIFTVFQNNLSGTVPISIWNLTKLRWLWLGSQQDNQLELPSGVPSTISNLQDLEWLNLTLIPLNTPLPQELFDLPNIDRLRIANCGLNGALPEGLSGIRDVIAAGNNFEGAIPASFQSTPPNFRLNISNNLFDFSDLEPLVQSNNYEQLFYSPQRTTDPEQNIESGVGSNITLSVTDDDINRNAPESAQNNQFQWFKDNVAISGATSATYEIFNAQETDSGVYFCEITNPTVPDLTIVRAPITLLIDASLSIDTEQNFNLSLYPNPAKEWLNIQFGETLEKGLLSIHDLNGRLIQQQRVSGDTVSLNIESLNSGMYILSIEEQNSKVVKRFMKQ